MIVCFLKHKGFLLKVYEQGSDLQCIVINKTGTKIIERWKTFYPSQKNVCVNVLVSDVLNELKIFDFDLEEIVYT